MLGLCAAVAGKEAKKGAPGTPLNAKTLAGSYYCGDGRGYKINFTLKVDGKFIAEWQGCMGKYGEASGKWTCTEKTITLQPSKEKGRMHGHLKKIDVLDFEGQWILVRTEDREFYEKWGASPRWCFRKQEKL